MHNYWNASHTVKRSWSKFVVWLIYSLIWWLICYPGLSDVTGNFSVCMCLGCIHGAFIMYSDVGVYQCCEWQTFSLASGSDLSWQSVWLHAQIGNPRVPLDLIFISSFNAKRLLLFIVCTCNMYWFSLCTVRYFALCCCTFWRLEIFCMWHFV